MHIRDGENSFKSLDKTVSYLSQIKQRVYDSDITFF